MDVEKMYNDWCEQAKKERENIEKKNILLSEYIYFKDDSTLGPMINQQENGEYSITLTLNYWNEDEIQKLNNSINNDTQ